MLRYSGTTELIRRVSLGSSIPKCGSLYLPFFRGAHSARPSLLRCPSPTVKLGSQSGKHHLHSLARQTFQILCPARQYPSSKLNWHRLGCTGVWSHIVRFSNSSARGIRKTYFPKPYTYGKSPKGGGPFSGLREALNALPSGIVLWTVLGLNGAVYLLWNIGISAAQNRDMSVLSFLTENFTLSWKNWSEGRFWTVLTSCFSNQATSHILMNALTFYFMAPPVLQILGNASFLTLYLGGGMVSSLITLYFNEHLLKAKRVVHGASGAIYAVISFMAATAPKATFLIFGIIPMPAWGCVAGLFTWDLLNAVSQRQTGVSEISHLSGIMCGIAYFLHKTGRLPRFF